MPLQILARQGWNRSPRFPAPIRSRVRSPSAQCSCDLASARSTVAIRSSIRVPVNIISEYSDLISGRGLILFLLGRSGITPPQSLLFHTVYPARFTIPAPGARQFLRTNSNSFACATTVPLRASLRCANAGCDLSLLRWPLPAFLSAAGIRPALRLRASHP